MITVTDLATEKCRFCDYTARQHEIIAENKYLYCMPSIGQISNGGHILIIPKKHFTCLGAMDNETFDAFEEFSARMKTVLTDTYAKPICFEHGIIGQSVPHAHLQMLPLDADLDARIQKDFKLRVSLKSIRDLQQVYLHRGVYLFSQTVRDEMYAYLVDHFPQYLRIVAAEVAGTPQRGDWKTWRDKSEQRQLDDQLMSETKRKLQQALK